MMKITILLALGALTTGANAALSLGITGLKADGSGASDSGTFVVSTDPGLPLPGKLPSPNSTLYSYQVTGLTIDGQGGYVLDFDMTVTASAGDGLTQEQSGFWMVDAGADAGNPDPYRITTGETVTFSISNALVSGGPTAATAAFTGFTAINFTNHGGTAGSADLGAGIFTGAAALDGGSGDRISGVDFGITVAVPEPSSTALLGLGGLALILRRRK